MTVNAGQNKKEIEMAKGNGSGSVGSEWELFTGQRRHTNQNSIGISRSKRLLIPPDIKDKLGDNVQLYFNKREKSLRIQPTTSGSVGAYPVRKNEQQNQYSVSLAALFGHYGLEPKETRYFPVEPDNGNFVINIADNVQSAGASSETQSV